MSSIGFIHLSYYLDGDRKVVSIPIAATDYDSVEGTTVTVRILDWQRDPRPYHEKLPENSKLVAMTFEAGLSYQNTGFELMIEEATGEGHANPFAITFAVGRHDGDFDEHLIGSGPSSPSWGLKVVVKKKVTI